MNYEFPHINNINDVLPAIADSDEFIVAERDGYTVINYLVAFDKTFPVVDSVEAAIRRECRGLVFDTNGAVLSRRFHKFFNAGERPETTGVALDRPHVILEKLDGSMITPLMIDDRVCWGTKMGLTEIGLSVREFVNMNPHRHFDMFARFCYDRNITPIFEFCSRSNRVVIDHPSDRLVLLGDEDGPH